MLWLQKLLHPTVLVVRDGITTCAKGKIPSPRLRDLDAVLAQRSISHATITIDGARRCHFSNTIPAEIHQRLRNILISS